MVSNHPHAVLDQSSKESNLPYVESNQPYVESNHLHVESTHPNVDSNHPSVESNQLMYDFRPTQCSITIRPVLRNQNRLIVSDQFCVVSAQVVRWLSMTSFICCGQVTHNCAIQVCKICSTLHPIVNHAFLPL